jgi:hypothetical protein
VLPRSSATNCSRGALAVRSYRSRLEGPGRNDGWLAQPSSREDVVGSPPTSLRDYGGAASACIRERRLASPQGSESALSHVLTLPLVGRVVGPTRRAA